MGINEFNQLTDASIALDTNGHYAAMTGWTAEQIAHAKSELEDAIKDGELWDENLTGYRGEMLNHIENILNSRLDRDDQWFEIQDSRDRNIRLYVNEVVDRDPDAYCSRFCDSQF